MTGLPPGHPLADYIDGVLLSEEEIASRVAELGHRITVDHEGRDVVLITVLRGGIMFLADLCRAIPMPVRLDFMAVTGYGPGAAPGVVRITKDLDEDVSGADVIVVEDIVDTGLSLNYLLGAIRAHGAASVEVCALLDKDVRRIVDLPIAYRGFRVPDRFVVGYGLDHRGMLRGLPYVATLKDEVMEA